MNWEGEYTLFDFFEKTKNLYPPTSNILKTQLNLFNYLATSPDKLIVRKFSSLTRGRVYTLDNKLVATSDNEGCCGFYQSLYDQYWKEGDLFEFFIENNHNLSWKIDEDCSSNVASVGASAYGLRGGGNPGRPFRSEYDFKLSHFLPAADKLPIETDIFIRTARFLSPLNIILTPKTKRKDTGYIHTIIHGKIKKLENNDIGETQHYLEILHVLQINHLINQDPSFKNVYIKYCQMCGIKPLDFSNIEKIISESKATIVKFTKPMIKQSEMGQLLCREDTTSTENVIHPSTFQETSNTLQGNIMSHYMTEPRAYWKVTSSDLETAQLPQYNGISFIIKDTKPRWKGNTGVLCIPKGSKEWDYLYNHIATLAGFIKESENISSVNTPEIFRKSHLWKL